MTSDQMSVQNPTKVTCHTFFGGRGSTSALLVEVAPDRALSSIFSFGTAHSDGDVVHAR